MSFKGLGDQITPEDQARKLEATSIVAGPPTGSGITLAAWRSWHKCDFSSTLAVGRPAKKGRIQAGISLSHARNRARRQRCTASTPRAPEMRSKELSGRAVRCSRSRSVIVQRNIAAEHPLVPREASACPTFLKGFSSLSNAICGMAVCAALTEPRKESTVSPFLRQFTKLPPLDIQDAPNLAFFLTQSRLRSRRVIPVLQRVLISLRVPLSFPAVHPTAAVFHRC